MKKKFSFREIDVALVNLAGAVIGTVIALFGIAGTNRAPFIAALAVLVCLLIGGNIVVKIFSKKENDEMLANLSFGMKEGSVANTGNFIKTFLLPVVFLDSKGTVIWSNDLFENLFEKKGDMKKKTAYIYKLIIKPRIELQETTILSDIDIGPGHYSMMCNVIYQGQKITSNPYYMLYFVDKTDFIQLKKTYDEERIAVGEIIIDNYEEIFTADGETVVNKIIAGLDIKFNSWLEGKGALIKRMMRDRYIFAVEDKHLAELREEGFSILRDVKTLNEDNTVPVTLSIGISAFGESVLANFESAESAMELALARGGDQAVVRIDGKDTYYGGSNIDIISKNQVKARLTAEKLKKEFAESNKIVIMGHSNPDMDAIGSALAVYRAATICGKEAKIVLNASNKSIDVMYRLLMAVPEYAEAFVNNTEILPQIDDDTLVVVVDTYTQTQTESPKVLEIASRIAVIDHHRKGADYIKNTVLDYSETYVSSTSELMVEVLRYIDPDIRIPVIEAEALYAGILVDTKNFVFKTGSRTFAVLGFLREMGVDAVNVKKFFLPDYETFSAVSKVTSNAEIISQRVAIGIVDQSVKDEKFVAALAADKLLEIAGIGASFVLTESPGGVAVSGRSVGEINVQVILEKMGGGGHLTAAGAFVKESTPQGVKMTLVRNIEEYFKA